MRTVWILIAVAAGLWLVMFSPWTRDAVPFWPAMTISSGLLALSGLWLNRKSLGEVFAFRWLHVPLGLVSAIVLYLMFFVGHRIATLLLPFASEQVGLVYRTRSQADLWLIGVLLLAWVGPAEEIGLHAGAHLVVQLHAAGGGGPVRPLLGRHVLAVPLRLARPDQPRCLGRYDLRLPADHLTLVRYRSTGNLGRAGLAGGSSRICCISTSTPFISCAS